MQYFLPTLRVLALTASIPLIAATATASAQTGVVGGVETLDHWLGGTTNDELGYSVANAGDVDGDGVPDQIIGAPGTSSSFILGSGSADVYSGATGLLLYQWVGTDVYGNLGHAVASAGDLNGDGFADVIVSAPGASPGGQMSAGSVYVYSGANGALLFQWNGSAPADFFGFSVANAGDTDGDGIADVLVGAHSANPGGISSAGSVYLYSGASGLLLRQWDGRVQNGWFGRAVSGASDINGDGFADVVMGAPSEDYGIAYVYSGVSGALLYQWRATIDSFSLGRAVAAAGDLNADGVPDLLIGAPFANLGGPLEVGMAYAFSGADGSILHQWQGNYPGDRFGSSASAVGDLNGDGFDDVLIGASSAHANGLPGAGFVYAYSGADGSVLRQMGGTNQNGSFGIGLATAGDVNNDGFPDILVGAYSSNAGSAYLLSLHPFMEANVASVSASAGGALNLDINFPDSAAAHEYKVLLSASGVGPTNYGVNIPLTEDRLVTQSFLGNYPFTTYSNLQGALDVNGDTTASITLPAGMHPGLIGRTFWMAAIANQAGQLPEFSSIAIAIEITP